MKRIKRASIVLIAVGLIVSLTMVIPASAKETKSDVKVLDSEFVLATMDSAGDIEEIQVFDQLSLDGKGTVEVKEKAAFEDVGGYQGVKSFTKPSVEDGFIVWPEITVDGPANVIATTKLSERDVEEAKTRIPLDVEFKYWFDGERVTDLNTITGKDGRFKMELTLTNTSKERTKLEYEDAATGEMVTDTVETYLPLVILPYDWYFDNSIFFNLEADPTGLVVYMPDFYNVGWSIPLFPPATDESHTIWVAADAKNFQMPPLTLAVAFTFPETNQADPFVILGPALEQIYGGMVQINEGIGSPTTDPSLLFGITAVDDGLSQMAAGLPEASTSINTAMIPGVDQMVAGIGSPTTSDTLLYADTAAISGLQGISAGIGSTTTSNTLLYAANALVVNLQTISATFGSATTPGTLINGVYSVLLGLNNTDPANPGVLQGLQQISAGAQSLITTLNGFAASLNPAGAGAGGNVALALGTSGGVNTALANLVTYVTGLTEPPTVNYDISTAAKTSILTNLGGIQTNMGTVLTSLNSALTAVPPSLPGIGYMYAALTQTAPPATQPGVIQSVQLMKAGVDAKLIPGVNQMYNGLTQIYGGLIQINAGIGTTTTPNTLLFAAEAIAGGLNTIKAGIGGTGVPDTLLYALAAIQGGLYQIKGGLSTGNMDDPGIKEGLILLTTGLEEAVAGLGSAETPDTLLYGTSQISGGLTDLGGGATQLEDGLAMLVSTLNLTDSELEVIAKRGEDFDHFLGRAEGEENNVRFVYQSKPTYNYETGSSTSWIVAIVISLLVALMLVAGGILLARRSTA